MKFKDDFHIYAIITIIFWSLAYVLTRLALIHFSAYSLGFLRYFVASCALIVIVIAVKIKPPKKSDLKWFALTGATGFFLYIITFNKGCETVTASTSSIIIATVPVITALIAHFIYKERLKGIQWVATALSFSGVALLTMFNGIFTISNELIWLLLAAVCLSLYNILQRKLTKTYSALQTSAFSIFGGTIMLSIFLPASVAEVKCAPAVPLLYVAILGVFSSAIAYVSWSKAFSLARNTSSVSNYMFVTPFLTTLLGFLLAGEIPDFLTILSGVIILSGLLLFNFGGRLITPP